MMKAFLNYKDIHPNFKLNGIYYGFDELKEVAYSLIKEGEEHEKHIGDFLHDWLDEKSEVEVKTSGSTGTPKAVLLQKQHMVNSAIATGVFFDLQEGNTALLCLSAEYIAGKMMLVRALILGLELDYVVPSSYPLQHVQKDFDFSAMVPLQLKNCMDKIAQIKTLLVGGTPLSDKLKKQIAHKSTQVYETYGMTETITHVAIKTTSKVTEGSRSHFIAIPDVLFSKDSRECLIISAPKITHHAVVTNDIVNLITDTEFEWLGRFDNVINSGGIKLFPEQIEAKLAPFIDHPFFVAGLPDEELGQKLVLVCEGATDFESILRDLKENQALEKFKIPKEVYQLSKFIRTDNGKIRRKESIQLIPV